MSEITTISERVHKAKKSYRCDGCGSHLILRGEKYLCFNGVAGEIHRLKGGVYERCRGFVIHRWCRGCVERYQPAKLEQLA
jgi:hypothetical protein